MFKIRKVLCLSMLIGLPIATCFFFTTSCGRTPADYSLYYRSLAQSHGQDIGLDISLFEVDFYLEVIDQKLKDKLDNLNSGTSINDPLEYIGARTFSFAGAIDEKDGYTIGTG
jgi:hypothetical protein